MRYVYLLLSVLVFMAGFWATQKWDRSLGLQRIPSRLEINRRQLEAIGAYLRSYHKDTERYPSNDEGLLAVPQLVEGCRRVSLEWHEELSRCRVDDSGILSIWGEPFIYENRKGLDARKFADSGANADTARIYSRHVDADVYIWSLGAQQAYQTYSLCAPHLRLARILIDTAALLLLALYVHSTVRSVDSRYTGLKRVGRIAWSLLGGTVLGLILMAIIFPVAMGPTCYIWGVTRSRTPKLTRDYLALMAKYRDRGIISGSAYEKLVKAISHEPHP